MNLPFWITGWMVSWTWWCLCSPATTGGDLAGGGTLDLLDGVHVASTLLSKTGLNLVVVAVLVAAVLDGG